MQGDVGGLIEDAIELGFLPRDIDTDKLRPGKLNAVKKGNLENENIIF